MLLVYAPGEGVELGLLRPHGWVGGEKVGPAGLQPARVQGPQLRGQGQAAQVGLRKQGRQLTVPPHTKEKHSNKKQGGSLIRICPDHPSFYQSQKFYILRIHVRV